MKTFGWIIFAFFAIGVGLYPIIYLLVHVPFGLLTSKPAELLTDKLWYFAFYVHIFLGGIALLTGWSQFSQRLRSRSLNVHRTLGKVYVCVSLASGIAALYISIYATGGPIASFGFGCLAIAWLFTTLKAYLSIRQLEIDRHQAWMIRSYALTFAAVTLRIWLPLAQLAELDFIFAYRIIAWLCWIPNLIVAELIIGRMRLPGLLTTR